MYGAENSDNPKKSLDAVDKFVKGLSIIPNMASVKHYAKTKVFLRKNVHLCMMNLIIGVTAVAHQLILMTDNIKDFRFIQNLKIENWFERI
ncbi:hypothetical protein [Sphingobacterium sp. B16(2022)]|uniref:hypothetical protein n=1 Tax=Sphingobacterium sp. B16(2022) TaxID=2914044 RepID=UPI0019D1F13D|nr:hypothetical protein [Sphingobacterium sp. B16(2022)]